MTKDEQVDRNIGHAFALLEELLDNPERLVLMSSGSNVVHMTSDDPDLSEANLAMVKRLEADRARSRSSKRRSALDDTTLLVAI